MSDAVMCRSLDMESRIYLSESYRDNEEGIPSNIEEALRSRKFSEFLRGNRQRYNATLTINRLPFELVAFIISLCQPPKPVASFDIHQRPLEVDYSWIYLTHVCQYWRSISLNSPALWVSIQLDSRQCLCGTILMTFLERSSPLPIELNYSYDFGLENTGRLSPQERALQAAFYESLSLNPGRIRELHFQEEISFDMEMLLSTQIPNLTSLQIHNFCRENLELSFRVQSVANLRRLSLGYVTSAIQKLKFPKLTHLYWSNIQRQCYDVHYADFMDMLESCSSTLIELVLYDAGPRINDPRDYEFDEARDMIHMLSIRNIEIYPLDHESKYPLFPLHGLVLPDTVTITWDAKITLSPLKHVDELEEEVEVEEVEENKAFRLPSPATLFRVQTLAIRTRSLGYLYWGTTCVIQGNTFNADIPASDIHAGVKLLSSFLPNVQRVAIDCTLKAPLLDTLCDPLPTVTSIHLSYQDSLAAIIAYLETGSFNVDGADESHLEVDHNSLSQNSGQDADNASAYGAGPSRPTMLPLISTLTFHFGNVDFRTKLWSISSELVKLGVPPIDFSNDSNPYLALRQRMHLEAPYTLRFRAGYISNAVLD